MTRVAGFADLSIGIDYSGPGREILNDFVLPVLSRATTYDRVTSFFTTDSLVSIASGLDRLQERQGRMRLVIGLHDVPSDLALAAASDEAMAEAIAVVRARVLQQVAAISDELERDRLATLAWMMQDGLLQVRVAAVECAVSSEPGIFHNKAMVFSDESGAVIAAVGSPNETRSGLGGNFEHLTVFTSWESPRYTDAQRQFFESLWSGALEGVRLCDLDAEFAGELLAALGKRAPKAAVTQSSRRLSLGDLIDMAKQMPAYAMVSGRHSALYPHQERAVLDALSRWPIRVLLADEVGLGKTFEAGAVISFVTRFCGARRVVILAPKAVVAQWQSELKDHFGIDSWVYDSGRRAYLSADGAIRPLRPGASPVGPDRPNVCIISAQLARGRGRGGHIFGEQADMPDLLVVDEAHSARVRPDISGAVKPTLMWHMLDEITRRVPHVIFATATPMQVHWREYHSLLRLLGLPVGWRKPENYERSLELIARDDPPTTLQDGMTAAMLILSTLDEMSPSTEDLSDGERALIEVLQSAREDRAALAERALSDWSNTRGALLKLHPAHLLTVRNTRGSLEEMGYRFPARNLQAPSMSVSDGVTLFYLDIDDYLSSTYFEVERALYPDRRFNVGFVKCGYQQRLASSLTACRLSLEGRRQRLRELVDGIVGTTAFATSSAELLDELDTDEEVVLDTASLSAVDPAEVKRLAEVEVQYIDGLLLRVESLLETSRDPKLVETIRLVRRALADGDQVLVFSRFTDTLDAVVAEFVESEVSGVGYGIFTGERASLHLDVAQPQVSRSDIRDALASGRARVLFCSDAASEGLNLQAARVLINVDVPWNPARLEQRIGRIARLGQMAETVDIFNIWYPNSIESRMYERLHARKELYDLAVGEFPDVVAESIRAEIAGNLAGTTLGTDPIAELQRLRRQAQVVALRKLWSREVPSNTITQTFRASLARLLCSLALSLGGACDADGDRYVVELEGERYVLSTLPGSDSAVSLSCPLTDRLSATSIDDREVRLSKACTPDGTPAAFAVEGAPGYVQPPALPLLLETVMGIAAALPAITDTEVPVWLPSPLRLTVTYEPGADSQVIGPAPVFWPPTAASSLESSVSAPCE